MKKILLITTIITLLVIFTACSNSEASATPATENNNQNTENMGANQNGEAGAMQMQGNSVVGLVNSVVGNEITIQVGEMQGGMAAGGQRPEGSQNGNGENAENQGEAQRPEGEEMPAREEGERTEGAEMPAREDGERTEGAQMPEGASAQGGMAQGGMAGMEEQDYSELITLTDEEKSFNIPVTTPVTQFGTEMTFSQITEEMYISIILDESDNIISINILG